MFLDQGGVVNSKSLLSILLNFFFFQKTFYR